MVILHCENQTYHDGDDKDYRYVDKDDDESLNDDNEVDLRIALAKQTSCRWPELKLLPPSFKSASRGIARPHIDLLSFDDFIIFSCNDDISHQFLGERCSTRPLQPLARGQG